MAPVPAPLALHLLRVSTAASFWQRFVGLLGRAGLAADEALLITPCNNIHTFFMRFAIDVVFLDRDGMIVAIVPRLRPWRIAVARAAHACLELDAGGAQRFGLVAGQHLAGLAAPRRSAP
ncbi:MAG: DUF192 domain-containing protein [Pseudomonadota bacterium]